MLVQELQLKLWEVGLDDDKRRELLQEMEEDKWPFYVDVYTISKLCSGNICTSSDYSVPGAINRVAHTVIFSYIMF